MSSSPTGAGAGAGAGAECAPTPAATDSAGSDAAVVVDGSIVAAVRATLLRAEHAGYDLLADRDGWLDDSELRVRSTRSDTSAAAAGPLELFHDSEAAMVAAVREEDIINRAKADWAEAQNAELDASEFPAAPTQEEIDANPIARRLCQRGGYEPTADELEPYTIKYREMSPERDPDWEAHLAAVAAAAAHPVVAP